MNAVLLLFLVSKFGLSDSTAGLIYSVFYFGIYVLSLVGGIIADRTQNYNRTIQFGLIIMAVGYVALAIPLFSKDASGIIADGTGSWLGILIFTCFALLCIAFGNGLFKGNLQALVGQMYDNFEAEAAKKGPEALAEAKDKRDSGFQIFYVFINIGGVIAPFVAPMLRNWWLKAHDFIYNADMPALCHQFLSNNEVTQKFSETMANSIVEGATMPSDLVAFSSQYIDVFNTGVHFSFIASVAAMLISLTIFFMTKKKFPQPTKKAKAETVNYTAEEKQAMAKEIKQRMAALFAVLGIAIFFWLSFHQNGQSLTVFARDFVITDSLPAEIWQALNPLYVIILTPVIMVVFGALARKGKAVSTPRKIAYGMGIAGCAYLFLMILSITFRRSIPRSRRSRHGSSRPRKIRTMGSYCNLFLPHSGRAVHQPSRTLIRFKGCSSPHGGSLPRSLARRYCHRKPLHLRWPYHVQRMANLDLLGRVPRYMPRLNVNHVRHG